MIPKYVFDNSQTCLNIKQVTIKDKLMNYRKLLYYNLLSDLKKSFVDKIILINKYKVKVSEVDYELQSLKRKEINKKL